MIIFDADDITYLVNNLSPEQLRVEIDHTKADLKRESDPNKRAFDEDYLQAVKIALEIVSPPPAKRVRVENFISVESVKAKNDIVMVAGRYTKLARAGRNYKGRCPFHDEKTASFTIYPDEQRWHCYGACSMGGDVISLVMKAERIDFKAALAELR